MTMTCLVIEPFRSGPIVKRGDRAAEERIVGRSVVAAFSGTPFPGTLVLWFSGENLIPLRGILFPDIKEEIMDGGMERIPAFTFIRGFPGRPHSGPFFLGSVEDRVISEKVGFLLVQVLGVKIVCNEVGNITSILCRALGELLVERGAGRPRLDAVMVAVGI